MKIAPALLIICLLCGCATEKYRTPAARTSDFAHLLVRGAWGVDSDIWIYSDDSYVLTEFNPESRRIETSRKEYHKGLFKAVIRSVEKGRAWNITKASLIQEVGAAAERQGISPPDVTDMSTDLLEIHGSGKVLKAEFYATDFTLEKLPSVRSLRTFSGIIHQIQEGTR